MTHRDDEKKEAVSEAISFLYPVMKYALLLLHQLREEKETLFDNDTHARTSKYY